jgi:hypothetical protein
MNQFDFSETILEVENIFGALKSEQRTVYFHLFGQYPKSILADTIKKILLQHNPADRFKQFPTTSEFQAFLKNALAGTSVASPEDLACLSRCDICGDTGWKIVEREEEFYPNEKAKEAKHEFAIFCDCVKGKMMKRAHRVEIEEARGRKEREIEPPLGYPAEWDSEIEEVKND